MIKRIRYVDRIAEFAGDHRRSNAFIKRVAFAGNLVLVVAIAWQVINSAVQLRGMKDVGTIQAMPFIVPDTAATDADRTRAVAAITQSHLFGSAAPQSVEKAVLVQTTQADIHVRGIISLSDKNRSTATIQIGEQPRALYTVGEALPDGQRVVGIMPLYIVLERGGIYEAAWLAGHEPDNGGTIEFVPQSAVSSTEPSSANAEPLSQTLSASAVDTVHGVLRTLAERKEPAAAFAIFQKAFKDGQFVGYRVFPGTNGQLLDTLGLPKGATIVGINGGTLDEASPLNTVLESVVENQQTTLELELEGSRRVLRLSK